MTPDEDNHIIFMILLIGIIVGETRYEAKCKQREKTKSWFKETQSKPWRFYNWKFICVTKCYNNINFKHAYNIAFHSKIMIVYMDNLNFIL